MPTRAAYMHLRLLVVFYLSLVCWSDICWAGGHSRVDRIIVKYKESRAQQSRSDQGDERRTLQHSKGSLRRAKHKTGNNADIYYLDRPRSMAEARSITQELMQQDDVEYAEPDYRRYPQQLINDPGYTQQWYLKRPTIERGAINAEQAWGETTGDPSIVIAVIDTGILPHEDINSGRVLTGYDFISDAIKANDGNGRDPDPTDAGDFVTAIESTTFEDCEESDSSWHGTLVSGVLIASTNNFQGITGLDHQASILPLRALGKCGGFSSDIADAIRWAAGGLVPGLPLNGNPANVINLSLGSEGNCSTTEQAAIDFAVAVGIVVVAATGNGEQVGIDAPANCNNVIAVAATTRDGAETCYTNVGTNVDLSAPGGNDGLNDPTNDCDGNDFIFSTGNSGPTIAASDAYEHVMGTSFAAPLVSGAAALMKAIDGSLTPTSIEAILKNTARAFPTTTPNDGFGICTTDRCGAGILDVFGAVKAAISGGLDSVPNPFEFEDRNNAARGTLVESNSVTITGIDTDATVNITGGEYSIDSGPFTSAAGSIVANQSLRIRLQSSDSDNAALSATLSVGGVSDVFTVTTGRRSGRGGGGGEAAWLLPLLIARRPRKPSLPNDSNYSA